MNDPYSPPLRRRFTSTGREVEYTLEELEELSNSCHDMLQEARRERALARIGYANPEQHGLVDISHKRAWANDVFLFSTSDGIGCWPYGVPVVVFGGQEYSSYPFSPNPDDALTHSENLWRLTLSTVPGLTLDAADWSDLESIHRIFARLHATSATELATQAILTDTTITFDPSSSNEVGEHIDTFLARTQERDPIDLADYQQRLAALPDGKDVNLRHLRIFDPRLMRYVLVPEAIVVEQPWNQLTKETDTLLRRLGLAPVRKTPPERTYHTPRVSLFDGRVAIERPQPADLRSIPTELHDHCSQYDTPNEPTAYRTWFSHAGHAAITTPLTRSAHATLLRKHCTIISPGEVTCD